MRIEDEESIMSSDDIAREVITLDETWHKVVNLVCKEGYASMFQVRRFIHLIRSFTACIEDLETYVENHLSTGDITDDVDDVVMAFEAVDRFIQRHIALSKEDLSLYRSLKSDLEDHLLHLLYIAEEVKLDDGQLLVICIPIP